MYQIVLTNMAEDRTQVNSVCLLSEMLYPAFISSKQLRQKSFSSFTNAMKDTGSLSVRE